MDLPWIVQELLYRARPIVVAWILPALLCYLGVSVSIRAAFAYRRTRRGLCPLCGYALHAEGAMPERCPECGALKRSLRWRCAASSRWLAIVIVAGLALSTPLALSAHPDAQWRTVALIVIASALGLRLAIETWRTRRRWSRKRIALRVAAALVLQVPWMIIAWNYSLVMRADYLVSEWQPIAPDCFRWRDPNAPTSPWLAWLPEEWSNSLGRTDLAVCLWQDRGAWQALGAGPGDELRHIIAMDPSMRGPTPDELRLLKQFPKLEDVWFTGVVANDEALEALRAMPPHVRIGGHLRDASGRMIGRIVDDGTDVTFEFFDAPVAP